MLLQELVCELETDADAVRLLETDDPATLWQYLSGVKPQMALAV